MSKHSPATPKLAATLFFCTFCDKPFSKEPQYKRHTAYCSKSKSRTRPRACRACNESKIKCNYSAPCQQCVRKQVKCLYDLPQLRRGRAEHGKNGSEAEMATDVTADTPIATSSLTSELNKPDSEANKLRLRLESDDMLQQFDQVQALETDTVPSLSLSQPFWSRGGTDDIQFDGIYSESSAMTVSAEEEGFMSLLKNSSTYDFDFQLDEFDFHNGKELQVPAFSPALPTNSIINSSSSISVPSPTRSASTIAPYLSLDTSLSGHFTKTKAQTSDREIFLTMIIDTVHAYPRMMMRRETFPPFIHAFSPAGEGPDERSKLPENLTNCMGIAQLFAACNDDTRFFVWGTIWAELKRLRSRASMFNKYEAISALQASLLYLIMRAVDEPPKEVNHDYEMLEIYQVVLKSRFIELTNHCPKVEDRSKDPQWVDWIFMESGRRIGWAWFILSLVFHLRTGVPCFISDHFREMPLPCIKTEWEAKNEAKWRIEHESAGARSRSTALRTFGDLIDSHQSSTKGRKPEGLDVWNAGIDHLGVLLNLAVHLV